MSETAFELGRRTDTLPAPPGVVWESLTEPRRSKAREWLALLDDEIEPQVVQSVRPTLVVWSSIWPRTPEQLIRFDLASDGGSGTRLTWTLNSPTPLEDPSAVGHRRYRLNRLIWANLRYSYGN
jgi:hypothetical protein